MKCTEPSIVLCQNNDGNPEHRFWLCKGCNMGWTNFNHAQEHLRGGPPPECGSLGSISQVFNQATRDYETETVEIVATPPFWYCAGCQTAFPTIDQATAHLKPEEPQRIEVVEESSGCGDLNLLNTDVADGTYKWMCTWCGKTFDSLDEGKAHLPGNED